MDLFDERLPTRFWNKVSPEPNSGCWFWVGALTSDSETSTGGYGSIMGPIGTATVYAHRWIMEVVSGPIPDGMQVDHRVCQNRCCVNPAHLEVVTQLINVQRGEKANRTHCPNGHEYTSENTRHRNFTRADGSIGKTRACRECGRNDVRARLARKAVTYFV